MAPIRHTISPAYINAEPLIPPKPWNFTASSGGMTMSASLARATVAVRRVIKETIIHVPYLLSFINVAAGTVENAPLESQLFFGDMHPTFASEKTPIGPTPF